MPNLNNITPYIIVQKNIIKKKICVKHFFFFFFEMEGILYKLIKEMTNTIGRVAKPVPRITKKTCDFSKFMSHNIIRTPNV